MAETLNLAGVRSGHSRRMCAREPRVGDSLQVGREQLPVESPDHCLLNKKVLYLPDNILACMQAFWTSYELEPTVVQTGWGFCRE